MSSYGGNHKGLTSNHRLESWVFADATARLAATGFIADDVGRVAYQQSDNSYWRLTDDSPVTWQTVTGGASSVDLSAHAATDATQTVKGHTSWEMIQDMLNAFVVAGTGVTLTYDDTANTLTIASTSSVTPEDVQDIVGAFVSGVSGVVVTYNDAAGTLVIGSTVGNDLTTHAALDATQTVHGHVSYEMIQDMLVSSLLGTTNLTVTYDDTANTFTLAVTGVMINPMTTAGDIVVGGASGVPTRLAKGSDNYVLGIDPTSHLPVWMIAAGGMSNPMTTSGDMIYGASAGAATRLPKGADGNILSLSSGLPVWINKALTGMQNPMTKAGDLIVGSGTATLTQMSLPVNGATAIASSEQTSHEASKVLDSDAATYWRSNTSPVNTAWIMIDLGQDRTIIEYRVLQNNGGSNDYANTYQLQSSPDGIGSWTQRAPNFAFEDSGHQALTVPTTARYWRLTASVASGNTGNWVIYTMELWGTPAIGDAIRLQAGPDTTALKILNGTPAWVPSLALAPLVNPMTTGGDIITGRDTTQINLATSALGAAFSASSGVNVGNAFDGNDSTYWDAVVTPVPGEWLMVDLGAPRAITSYRMFQPNGGTNFYSNNTNLQSSDDGVTWTNRVSGIGTDDTGTVAISGGPITARYWRLLSIGGNSAAWRVFTFTLVGSGVGLQQRLAKGSDGHVLAIDPTTHLPVWEARVGSSSLGTQPAASRAGKLFLPTDGFTVQLDNGAAYNRWGPLASLRAPIDTDFAWVNQVDAAVDATKDGIWLYTGLSAAASGMRIRRLVTTPTPPYTVTACMKIMMHQVQYANAGIGFRQSSDGKIHKFSFQADSGFTYLTSTRFNDATSFNGNYKLTVTEMPELVWLRIQDTGVNRILSWSTNGQFFLPFDSIGRTDFLTADQVFFYVEPNNANAIGLLLLGWDYA